MWEAALIKLTYPRECTCLERDYRFTIPYPAPGEKLTGEPGTDFIEEQPLHYEQLAEFLMQNDLNLPDDRLVRRLLHFSERAPHWKYSDEVLCASDCSSTHEVCTKLEHIINRVLRRVHNDPNVRVMIAAGPQPRIHIISPCVKFILLAPARESILRALGFYSPSYNVKTQTIDCSVHYLYCGDFGHPATKSDRSPAFQWIQDIYVYTDIEHPLLVSNSLANLLDAIPVTSSTGEIGVHRPSHPHFVRLLVGDLSSIEIRLCTDDGEELPISYGLVLCQLQIRRVMMTVIRITPEVYKPM